jgi:hypothetical protein
LKESELKERSFFFDVSSSLMPSFSKLITESQLFSSKALTAIH